MQLSELFEDVDSDVEASRKAEEARKLTLHYVEELNVPWGKWPYAKIHFPRRGNDAPLVVNFVRSLDHKRQRGSFHFDDTGYDKVGTLSLVVPGKGPLSKDEVVALLNSRDGASFFRHEYIHYLDILGRFSTKGQGSLKEPTDDAEDYVNQPVEINAFFHQIAEPCLKVLRAARDGGPQAAQEAGKIDPDFKQYLRHQNFHENYRRLFVIANWSQKNRQRYIKRLYLLHKAATAIQGVGESFGPTKVQKILRWLADQLNKTRKWHASK